MRLPFTGEDKAFTLIEVLIAIGILAVSMATVFGSNVGAARSASHARALTNATLMARCRMVEAEAYLLKNQLPLLDQTLEDPPEMGSDPCCSGGVTCEAKVEQIELPTATDLATTAGNSLLTRGASAAQGMSFAGGGLPGGGLTPPVAGAAPDAGVGGDPLSSLLGMVGSMAGAGGAGGAGGAPGGASPGGAPSATDMAGMMLTAVYPTIKPLLEGAIRKVTINVRWFEGTRAQTFSVVQYVTNPGQTLPSATGAPGGDGGVPATPPPGGTTQPAPGGALPGLGGLGLPGLPGFH